MKKRLLAKSLIIALIVQIVGVCGQSVCSAQNNNVTINSEVQGTSITYEEYVAENGGIKTIHREDIKSEENKVFSFNDGNLLQWNFLIPDDGWYAFELEYCLDGENGGSGSVKMMLDNKVPFENMEQIGLKQFWIPNKITVDSKGNDVRMPSKADKGWHSYTFKDEEDVYLYPFEFYITKGSHTISFELLDGSVNIRNLRLYSYQKPIAYSEYLETHKDKYNGKKIIKAEAEMYSYTNSLSVNAANDITSTMVTPYSPQKLKLNVLGGENWKYTGDSVEWVIEAPQEGLYAASFVFKQNYREGLSSYRRMLLNGEVPFDSANYFEFKYGNDWQCSDSFYLHLNKGKNTITLECTMGAYSEVVVGIDAVVAELNELYRQIIMITGTNPDIYRDYSLEAEITDFEKKLSSIAEDTNGLIEAVVELVGDGGQTRVLKDVYRQISDMIENISTITKNGRLSRFKSNISSLASFSMELRENPLLLDSIVLSSADAPYKVKKETAGQKIKHGILRFIATFIEDYSSGAQAENGEELTVWINTGREQMHILSQLANNDLSDVSVRLQLVTGSVVQAILAGRAPDVVLNRGEAEILNYSMRGALVDLSDFNDFKDIKQRFSKTAMLPFAYEDGIYALPETQNFDMMFVRTDVLNELGLGIPKTWEDFTEKILLVLKRNNLVVGVGNLNTAGALHSIFTTMLVQNGGSLYTEDLMQSNLISSEAMKAFDFVISLYREYGIPTEYNFLNRFRTGEMPIAIAPYTEYNTLMVTAPEIDGLWEMLPIPGVKRSDGTINNSQYMTNTGGVILAGSDNKEAGWKFLKWWTSESIQKQFGLQQEAKLGASGRYATANLDAMKGLLWGAEQLNLLESQRASSTCFNHIPGSYYVGRAINNATVVSVTDTETIPREELIKWNELIENELVRKRKEFNYKGALGGESE